MRRNDTAGPELVLYGRAFVPEMIPAETTVRCGNCRLVDQQRQGHTQTDCLQALKQEVALLRLELAAAEIHKISQSV